MAKDDPFAKFIITRKRKLYKFANFESYSNSFELDRNQPELAKDWIDKFFSKKQPLVLEIAAGNAQFSLELARRHKDRNFIAIDIKSDRLYTSAKKALAENCDNIAFIRMHMNELLNIFDPNSISEIWLTFPDPHPKKRNIKHRLTHPHFLKIYEKLLVNNGQLKYKTDNLDLFQWSLEQFVAEKWQLKELTFDLHESDLPEEYKIKTHYEEKFTTQNLRINYCSIIKQ